MTQTQTLQSAGTIAVPAIELRGLTKSFGSVRAVRGIDLTVRPGEIIAFLGPNGAGKTTTIDMMLGLSRPDAGSVQVYGMEPVHGRPPRAHLGRHADRRPAQGPHRRGDPAAHGQPVQRHPPGGRGAGPSRDRRTSPTVGWSSARAASSSGCGSPWRCCPTPSCSSSTSRPPAWTSPGAATSGRPSARTPSAAAPCSSRRTTSRRRTPTPTGSSWSATARSWPTAPRRRSRRWCPGAPCEPPCRTRMSPALQRLPGSRRWRCGATRSSSPPPTATPSRATSSRRTEARDLEITSRGLEDAFISLTTEGDQS